MAKMTVQVDSQASDNMAANLAMMQETGELCDFSVTVGRSCVKAHRCILAANCEYFHTMFRFNESDPASTMDLTHLDCAPSVVASVIKSFYTNQIELDQTTVEAVLRLVDFLMCVELQNSVETYMKQTLSFHTASIYFQLAIQYSLNTTSLFHKAQSYLWYRFHDYFIHQPDTNDLSINVLQAFQKYGIFHYCTPLQVLEVFLNHLKNMASNQDDNKNDIEDDNADKQEKKTSCSQHVGKVFDLIACVLNDMSKELISNWMPHLCCFLTVAKQNMNLYSSFSHLDILQNRIAGGDFGREKDSFSSNTVSHDIQERCNEPLHDNNIVTEKDHHTKTLPVLFNQEGNSLDKNILTSDHLKAAKETGPEIINSKEAVCDGVCVLAPSAETSAQVMAVDEGPTAWPRVASPHMTLALYDTRRRVWRTVDLGEWPVAGPMYERHAWRIAVCHQCLYCFSLMKAVGLEFDLRTKTWTHLKCSELFTPHNEASPVKSVIPIDVGGKLIVLSMSRERGMDGTFSTLQNFHELDFHKKTFACKATVQGDKADMPITQWTREGSMLVTVKASTMMYRNISCVQYIHEYDTETCQVKTHNVQSAMESGIRLMMNKGVVYLMDKEGWCRTFDLSKGDWCSQTRYPAPPNSAFTGHHDSVYPALTRVTCHAGRSRWEVTTHSPNLYSAATEELHVTDSASIGTSQHPPPPCQYVTALCPAHIDQALMDSLPQALFEFAESKNV